MSFNTGAADYFKFRPESQYIVFLCHFSEVTYLFELTFCTLADGLMRAKINF